MFFIPKQSEMIVYPDLFVEFYNASVATYLERIAELREIVIKIYNTIYNVGDYSSKFTQVTKAT